MSTYIIKAEKLKPHNCQLIINIRQYNERILYSSRQKKIKQTIIILFYYFYAYYDIGKI